jgi:hypothetical protein
MDNNSAPPPPPKAFTVSQDWLAQSHVRKEYREERASEMEADLEAAKIAETSAVALAQVVIKSGFILNGGGIIAIPTVFALFNLDAEKILPQVALTALLYVVGLCCAFLASICAFFALANKADNFYSNAVRTARNLEAKYFPHQSEEMKKQAEAAKRRADRLRIFWVTERFVAIILCFASLALFIAGAYVGGKLILNAPHKAPASAKAASSMTILRPAT